MTRNLFLLLLPVISITACKKPDIDKSIAFTTDFSMNPSQPRFGIEIKHDTVFYCEEKMDEKGVYNYYYCIHNKDSISKIQVEMESTFTTEFMTMPFIDDAALCHLQIVDGSNTSQYTFHLEDLDSAKGKALNNLLALRNCDLRKMRFHQFPEALLKNKMPKPPPVHQ